MNQAKEGSTVDLFLSHVEPLETMDVFVDPSADLVVLEAGQKGLEIMVPASMMPQIVALPEPAPAKEAPALALVKEAPAEREAARSFFDAATAFHAAIKDLREERSDAARRILERLVRDHPASSEYLAALSMARFQLMQSELDKLAEANRLAEAVKTYPYCVTTLEMLGRMYRRLNRPSSAARYFKEAATLEPSRSDLLAELRTMNALVEAEKRFAEAPVIPIARQNTSVRRARATVDQRQLDQRAMWIAVAVFAMLTGALFFASNILEAGARELYLEPDDPLFWIRQGVLLVFGTGGALYLLRRRPFATEELALSGLVVFAAVALGLFAGMILPLSMSHSGLAVLIGMVALQVIAEEIFFRAYLGRVLVRGTVGSFAPIAISAGLYGAYQLTYVAVWSGGALDASAFVRVGAAVFAGAVYGTLQVKSGSLSAALVAHAAAATVVMLGSSY
jgi:membrane protease YdiL (CAAX protease family)